MDVEIIYYNSPVGLLQLKGDGQHVHALYFCETGRHRNIQPDEAEKAVKPVSKVLQQAIIQLGEYFAGTRRVFDLPLQQEGTDFRQIVWKELLNIPYGKTISYLELSKRIGNTKAIRAVGTANGSNNISIIVPCHRVIGSSGELVGYGGDLWRKKWLLAHEGKFGNGVQTLF